ncbi:J domain-containing protein [Nocardioides sp.]|uniref:J domain-containing protein n=1 Tax=Nocardioides sp. TaxID=35761 RepID=UPI0039E2959E
MTFESPTWYDLLGVEPTASTEEIRAAWKAAIADLDPTDRRFQRLNDAAAVLLDPHSRQRYDRQQHDATLPTRRVGRSAGAEGPESAEVLAPESPSRQKRWLHRARVGRSAGPTDAESAAVLPTRHLRRQHKRRLGTSETSTSAESAREGAEEPTAAPVRRREVPGWVLAVLGVLAIALVATAAYSWSRPNPKTAESDAREALEVAERAIVPVLSYDYRTLEEDEKEADSYLTDRYRTKDFDPIFATIKKNAPDAQTVVTTSVVASSVVRAGDGRVEVMLLVDRPTTNKATTTPILYEDHVTVTMQKTDGSWLIDNLTT